MSGDRPTMYALLVGINRYASSDVPDLGGCVNDVDAMEQLLHDKFSVASKNIKKLTNDQATYQAIQEAFREHLTSQARAWAEAGKEGAAPAFLFHYSGHGSQAPDETGTEPDGLDETIVPHDSRIEGVYDIKDWELGQWLHELNKYSDNVTVILDCCHSGSGLKKPNMVRARRCKPDLRPQPLQRPPASIARTRGLSSPSGWVMGEKHVLLAGCLDREESNEHIVQEGEGYREHGALSYFLIQELSQMSPERPLTYRELHERVRFQVNTTYQDQTPQCEGDRDRLVFGGLRPARDLFLSVVDTSEGLIWVDGGVAHGLTEGSQLHVYPAETRTLEEAGPPLATLCVAKVGAVRSGCSVEDGEEDIPIHAQTMIYRLNHGDMQRRVVLDIPEGEILDAVRTHLSQDLIAPYVKLAPSHVPADFRVQLVDASLELQDSSGKRLVAPFPLNQLPELGRDLAHIIRYQNALKLQNTASYSELAGLIGLSIKKLDFDPDTQQPIGVPFETPQEGEIIIEAGQRIVLEVTNHSEQDLYLAIFNFSHDWAILQLYPSVQGSHEALPAGEALSLGLSRKRMQQLAPSLPQELNEVREYIKVIATLEDTDFEVLQQKSLKEPYTKRKVRAIGHKPVSALGALLGQAMSGGRARALGSPPASVEDEWNTAQIAFHVIQPPQG